MATKRKVNNLLALAVLSTLFERPMHRYEIAAVMRERGKDRDMDIKWGSLYTVVQNLEKHGFLEIIGSERDGARPERTIYAITPAGRDEALDWTRELLSTPEPTHDPFVAGLGIAGALPPDEVYALLGDRLDRLDERITTARAESDKYRTVIPRLFLIEAEFGIAMLEAEVEWVRTLREELSSGTFPDLDLWRRITSGSLDLQEAIKMVERGEFTKPA